MVAIAVEPRNHLSLAVAEAAIAAGKHIWFDKPAGDNFESFARMLDQAVERGLQVQMGYMFRYSPAFATVAEWARSPGCSRKWSAGPAACWASMPADRSSNRRVKSARAKVFVMYRSWNRTRATPGYRVNRSI